MANLQVKNIPDELYESLRAYARENNCTISAAVVSAVEAKVAMARFSRRLAERPATYLPYAAADVLTEERAEREGGAE